MKTTNWDIPDKKNYFEFFKEDNIELLKKWRKKEISLENYLDSIPKEYSEALIKYCEEERINLVLYLESVCWALFEEN